MQEKVTAIRWFLGIARLDHQPSGFPGDKPSSDATSGRGVCAFAAGCCH